jgi:hypothetical protein
VRYQTSRAVILFILFHRVNPVSCRFPYLIDSLGDAGADEAPTGVPSADLSAFAVAA